VYNPNSSQSHTRNTPLWSSSLLLSYHCVISLGPKGPKMVGTRSSKVVHPPSHQLCPPSSMLEFTFDTTCIECGLPKEHRCRGCNLFLQGDPTRAAALELGTKSPAVLEADRKKLSWKQYACYPHFSEEFAKSRLLAHRVSCKKYLMENSKLDSNIQQEVMLSL
jgi:hypothetical protein